MCCCCFFQCAFVLGEDRSSIKAQKWVNYLCLNWLKENVSFDQWEPRYIHLYDVGISRSEISQIGFRSFFISFSIFLTGLLKQVDGDDSTIVAPQPELRQDVNMTPLQSSRHHVDVNQMSAFKRNVLPPYRLVKMRLSTQQWPSETTGTFITRGWFVSLGSQKIDYLRLQMN